MRLASTETRSEHRHRWSADNARNVQLYSALVQRYGESFQALDWSSRESQNRRFAILEEVACLHNASVLDVGCGFGDFYGRMKASELQVRYTGIDIAAAMIDRACARFPEANFCLQDPLDASPEIASHDYVLSSGIFAKRRTAPLAFLKAMVGRMFELANHAVAFNSLSSWAEEKEASEFYADPAEVLQFCRTLTPWVVLRHDYHPRDFTVYMYKTAKA